MCVPVCVGGWRASVTEMCKNRLVRKVPSMLQYLVAFLTKG